MRAAAILRLVIVIALGATPAAQAAAPAPQLVPGDSIAGRFLVASEALDDPNFARTVVYMIDHDDEGAMGLVINRVIARGPLGALLGDLGLEGKAAADVEIPVHYGGPVQPEIAFVLHSADYERAGTRQLSDALAVTASLGVLEDIAAGQGPAQSLLAVGYAGWAPGQLEQELVAGAWHVVEAGPGLIFEDEVESRWQNALDRRGLDL